MQNKETIEKLKKDNMKSLTSSQETVYSFLGKFSNSTIEILESQTAFNRLTLSKILKGLVEKGLVTKSDSNPPTYKCVEVEEDNGVEDVVQTEKKVGKAKKEVVEKEEEEEEVVLSGSRDTDKLKFNGELYGKGRLVLAVVKKYVEDHPKTTVEKLREVFPDIMQPRYGMFQEVSKAKKMSVDRDRYFLKPEDLIKVGDKKIAVCSQFGKHNLPLKHFKSLGFTIK